MQARGIDDILAKVNEMRAAFALGQHAIPFLEEVFEFMKEVAPLLAEFDTAIPQGDKSSQGQQPELSLDAPQRTTAEAANLARVLEKMTPVQCALQVHVERLCELEKQDAHLEYAVRELEEKVPEQLDGVRALLKTRQSSLLDLARETRAQVAAIDELSNEVSRIVASLNAEHDAAQQIAAAHHVVRTIRSRVDLLAERLEARAANPDEAWRLVSPAPGSPSPAPQNPEAKALLEQPGSAEQPTGPAERRAEAQDQQKGRTGGAKHRPLPRNVEWKDLTEICRPPSQEEIDALFQDRVTYQPQRRPGSS